MMTLVAHGSNDSSSSAGVAESPRSVFCRFALDSSSSLGEFRLRGLVAAAGEAGADMARSSGEARVSRRGSMTRWLSNFRMFRLRKFGGTRTGDRRWVPGAVVEADDPADARELIDRRSF